MLFLSLENFLFDDDKSEEIREKQKKTHRFNVVQQIAYVYAKERKTFTILKLRLHKRGIYTNHYIFKFQRYP